MRHERLARSVRDLGLDLDTLELTARIYRVPRSPHFTLVTKAQRAAMRRALAALTREGHVVRFGALQCHACRWRAAP